LHMADIYHFRTAGGFETDIVLEDSCGKIVGIEVKSGATVTQQDFKGLRVLEELAGKNFVRGIVLYAGEQVVPFGKNMHALPIEHLWA
jgi:uncharacterized protein